MDLIVGRTRIETPRWREVGGAIAIGIVACAIVLAGGVPGILLLFGLLAAAGVAYLALRFPTTTIALWLILGQGTLSVLRFSGAVYVGGGVDLLPSDPILFGIAVAMVVKILRDDRHSYAVLFRHLLFWTLFIAWVLVRLVASIDDFGAVSALGEFRYTFHYVLTVPYILIFFRTRTEQMRVFWVTVVFALSLLVVGVGRGAVLHGFTFAPYMKWLPAPSNVALLAGAFGVYLAHQYGQWSRSEWTYISLLLFVVAMTIISGHRSVWMASVAGLGLLTFLGHIQMAKAIKFGIVLVVSSIIIDVVFSSVSIIDFIDERVTPFVAIEEDNTARWRVQIWMDAWRASQEQLWQGKGLGNYFPVTGGRSGVGVSLHGQYIQLVYQVGIVGLALYLMLVGQIFRHLIRAYRKTSSAQVAVMTGTALTVLGVASVYYVGYGFDFCTWVFVGIGVAASLPAVQMQNRRG